MPASRIIKRLRTACTGCGTCCTDTIVPVNAADIRRLMKASGLPAAEIVRLYDSTEIGYDTEAEGWIRFRNGRRIIGLRQKFGRCMFLSADARCRMYASRPTTCRLFPLQVEYDDAGINDLLYIKGVDCKRTRGGKLDAAELLQLAYREDREDEAFYRVIRRWNREKRQGGKKAFLAFAGLADEKR